MLSQAALALALLGYGLALGLLAASVRAGQRARGVTLVIAAIGWLGHVVWLVATERTTSALLADSFTTFGAATVLMWLVWAAARAVRMAGLIVLPVTAASLLLAVSVDVTVADRVAVEGALGVGLAAHIVIALAAHALLGVAFAHALVMAMQEHALRRHRWSNLLAALPPLSSAERVFFAMLAAGLILLTLTLLSGAVFVDDLFAQDLAHKTVLSSLSWVVFAILLIGRWRWGWRGKTALRWTIVGMGLLLLAHFGSKFVLQWVLGR